MGLYTQEKCVECNKKMVNARYGRCEDHLEEERTRRAVLHSLWKFRTQNTTPAAVIKTRNIKKGTAFKWKAGVVYGRGRL